MDHEDMANAYKMLHADGYAHSIEIWERKILWAAFMAFLSDAFFGESMFLNKLMLQK